MSCYQVCAGRAGLEIGCRRVSVQASLPEYAVLKYGLREWQVLRGFPCNAL